MARCVVQSILSRAGFDERDMAHRYINEPLLQAADSSFHNVSITH